MVCPDPASLARRFICYSIYSGDKFNPLPKLSAAENTLGNCRNTLNKLFGVWLPHYV